MNTNEQTDETFGEDPRVSKLIDEAGLPPTEAERLRAVLRDNKEETDDLSSPRSSEIVRQKAAFLRHDPGTSDEAVWRGARRQAVMMGVFFGVFTGLAFGIFKIGGVGFQQWPVLLISGTAQGLLFGYLMYRFLLAPGARRLIQLRTEVGAPIDLMIEPRVGQCPTCGAEEAQLFTWKHWINLHWALNPGLVINELLLGQRIPRNMQRCKQCETWYVDCSSCDGSIDTAKWSRREAFFRWGGLTCPDCDGPIPCQRNALAWIIELPFRPFFPRRPSSRKPTTIEAS